MRTNAVFTVSKWILLFAAWFGLAVGTAWADSGVRLKSGPTQLDPNPPCMAEKITRFQFEIENTNCVCDEDVEITLGPLVIVDPQLPPSAFEFLGFSESSFELEDETTKTITFSVRTKPVSCLLGSGMQGFSSASFKVKICDGGGGCDWGLATDPPCPIGEGPRIDPIPITLVADTTLCPQTAVGTGTIQGTVVDSSGRPLAFARVTARKGCRGQPDFVDQSALTSNGPPPPGSPPRGQYRISGLPDGSYDMEVREGGRCATATGVILTGGGVATQNFTLTAACP